MENTVPVSITCPRCGMTSHNPHDIEWGYCGNCHAYTGVVNPVMKAKNFLDSVSATGTATHPGYWPDGDLGDDPDGDIAGYDGR